MVDWGDVHEERRATLATFEALAPEQWQVQSLCGAWTVRQVLGHLVVATDPRLRHFLVPVLRAFGSFDKANDRLARAEAERPVDELLARYRERYTNQLSPPMLPLNASYGDAMLHNLDVRIPLGMPADRPPDRWAPVLDILVRPRATAAFLPRGRPKLRWVGTDHDWSHGEGPEVRGTMADLALAASARGARVDHLEGDGQPALARWLAR